MVTYQNNHKAVQVFPCVGVYAASCYQDDDDDPDEEIVDDVPAVVGKPVGDRVQATHKLQVLGLPGFGGKGTEEHSL